jgi:hypothetical protein
VSTITCPECNARIHIPPQVGARTICPRCVAEIDNPDADPAAPPAGVAREVGRGLSATSIVLAVLIGLCIVGIIVTYMATSPGHMAGLEVLVMSMYLFALLDVLVSIAFVRSLWRWGLAGIRAPSAVRVLGLVGLSIATVAAVVVFFFVTCFALANLKD